MTETDNARIVLTTALTLLSTARWKLNYHQWLERIPNARDDDYWKDKWREWDTMCTALTKFDANTLACIVTEPGT